MMAPVLVPKIKSNCSLSGLPPSKAFDLFQDADTVEALCPTAIQSEDAARLRLRLFAHIGHIPEPIL
jgi:hypothetical protein